MLKKRIIPSLLTDGQNLVKGQQFNSWRTVSSVVTAAKIFAMRDVDELLLLDVMASKEGRAIDPFTVKSVADCLQVPFTVGGGVRDLLTFESTLRAGADKVVIGTYAIQNPGFLSQAADTFGSQAVVACLDIADELTGNLAIMAGSTTTNLTVTEAVKIMADHGAGEIIIQNVSRDGMMTGMANDIISTVTSMVSVPVISSSGASNYEDMESALASGATGVAVGALFQFTECTPKGARDYLSSKGYSVRN